MYLGVIAEFQSNIKQKLIEQRDTQMTCFYMY